MAVVGGGQVDPIYLITATIMSSKCVFIPSKGHRHCSCSSLFLSLFHAGSCEIFRKRCVFRLPTTALDTTQGSWNASTVYMRWKYKIVTRRLSDRFDRRKKDEPNLSSWAEINKSNQPIVYFLVEKTDVQIRMCEFLCSLSVRKFELGLLLYLLKMRV